MAQLFQSFKDLFAVVLLSFLAPLFSAALLLFRLWSYFFFLVLPSFRKAP